MDKLKNIISLIIAVTTLVSSCSAFLLNRNCPAPSPCGCSSSLASNTSNINCKGKHLNDIPEIQQSNLHVETLVLNFQSNAFTIIHDNIFRNVRSFNVSSISLNIDSNQIHTIDNDAFSGIEEVTSSLNLNGNNLTTIPSAIGKLVNLKNLNIQTNPIHSIDSSAMQNIGKSLTQLSLDFGSFTKWPQELHYLRALQSLVARYIPFSYIDVNAFQGFETTLTNLIIDHSQLEKVPNAICHLRNLTTLHFKHNSNLKENTSSIFEPCIENLPSVTHLYLNFNRLHKFPDVFPIFPSLTLLSLYSNALQYIESSKIPSTAKLTTLSLNHNVFERIPSALDNLKTLENLGLDYNHIKTIEPGDFSQLTMLRSLSLYLNPIVYVAPTAFIHNVNLETLIFVYSHLDHIPVAVTYLTNLRDFRMNSVNCTCDMSYLKHWNVSAVTSFRARCASSTETIKSFVMNSLQSCP